MIIKVVPHFFNFRVHVHSLAVVSIEDWDYRRILEQRKELPVLDNEDGGWKLETIDHG